MNPIKPVRANVVKRSQFTVKIVHDDRLTADITADKVVGLGQLVPKSNAIPRPSE